MERFKLHCEIEFVGLISTGGRDDVEVEGETEEGSADAVNVEHQGGDEMRTGDGEGAYPAFWCLMRWRLAKISGSSVGKMILICSVLQAMNQAKEANLEMLALRCSNECWLLSV